MGFLNYKKSNPPQRFPTTFPTPLPPPLHPSPQPFPNTSPTLSQPVLQPPFPTPPPPRSQTTKTLFERKKQKRTLENPNAVIAWSDLRTQMLPIICTRRLLSVWILQHIRVPSMYQRRWHPNQDKSCHGLGGVVDEKKGGKVKHVLLPQLCMNFEATMSDQLCYQTPLVFRSLGEVQRNRLKPTNLASLAGQAAWYRMESGPKAENGKKLPPPPRKKKPPHWKKWHKNGKEWDLGSCFYFFRHLWAMFSPFRAVGSQLIFPVFSFRPAIRSLPCRSFNSFLVACELVNFARAQMEGRWNWHNEWVLQPDAENLGIERSNARKAGPSGLRKMLSNTQTRTWRRESSKMLWELGLRSLRFRGLTRTNFTRTHFVCVLKCSVPKRLHLRSVCVCFLKRAFEGGRSPTESPKSGCNLKTCVARR